MQKVVLITGASTGIGADAVRTLIQNGFAVVATVRKTEDEIHLKNLYGDKVKVIRLEMTDFSEIEKLPQKLTHDFDIKHLYGLVNNAGVALAGPFAHQNFSEVQNIIQINVLSVMKITQVLLPMLKTDSRIINISSVAGKTGTPFLAVYAASKHAVEGFSEALRKEMTLLGIKVIVVAPGSIKTPIWKKGFEVVKDSYKKTVFASAFDRFIKFAMNEEKNGLEVAEVSSDIVKALTLDDPKVRYAPIPRKLVNWYLPKFIPTKIYDRLTAKALGLLPK